MKIQFNLGNNDIILLSHTGMKINLNNLSTYICYFQHVRFKYKRNSKLLSSRGNRQSIPMDYYNLLLKHTISIPKQN